MAWRESLRAFAVPEPATSVKLIFDNVRNYIICATFLALSVWLRKGAPGAPTEAKGPRFHEITEVLASLALLVGGCLLLLNVLQSLEFYRRAIDATVKGVGALSSKAVNALPTHLPKPIALLVIVALMLILIGSAIALLLALLILALSISVVLVYLMLFAGASSRAF